MTTQRDDGLTQTLLTCEHLDHHTGRRRGFTLIPQAEQADDGGDDDRERGEVYVYVCPACAPLLAALGRVAVAPLPSSGG